MPIRIKAATAAAKNRLASRKVILSFHSFDFDDADPTHV
jgi:hypothetical protein